MNELARVLDGGDLAARLRRAMDPQDAYRLLRWVAAGVDEYGNLGSPAILPGPGAKAFARDFCEALQGAGFDAGFLDLAEVDLRLLPNLAVALLDEEEEVDPTVVELASQHCSLLLAGERVPEGLVINVIPFDERGFSLADGRESVVH